MTNRMTPLKTMFRNDPASVHSCARLPSNAGQSGPPERADGWQGNLYVPSELLLSCATGVKVSGDSEDGRDGRKVLFFTLPVPSVAKEGSMWMRKSSDLYVDLLAINAPCYGRSLRTGLCRSTQQTVAKPNEVWLPWSALSQKIPDVTERTNERVCYKQISSSGTRTMVSTNGKPLANRRRVQGES